jgi:ABC-type multidrug transport system ATPase subunit
MKNSFHVPKQDDRKRRCILYRTVIVVEVDMVKVNKLEWWDVQLSLLEKNRKGEILRRQLLVDQAGELQQGQLLAIMGPSGCGKTSLLSVISGRVAHNSKFNLFGNVSFNGVPISKAKFNKKIAVVAQDDTLFAYLTVRETLFLAAYFAGGEALDRPKIDAMVDAVLKELNLIIASETIVGSPTRRGVSGGEYKRVLIGKELMKKPRTIFLDEPTSGLDAFQAFAVIDSMKTLAARNKIVVSVIHQPRSSIFNLFDLLLLLSAGRLMYFGKASHAAPYFSAMGYPCPEHFNPADFFLDLLSVNSKSAALETESRARIDALARAWADPLNAAKSARPKAQRRVTLSLINPEDLRTYSAEGKDREPDGAASESKEGGDAVDSVADSDDECDEIVGSARLGHYTGQDTSEMHRSRRKEGAAATQSPGMAAMRWFNAFGLLLWRALVEIFRNYAALAIRTGTVLFYAMIVSLIYQNTGYTQQSIQDRTGLLYFMLINQVVPVFDLL